MLVAIQQTSARTALYVSGERKEADARRATLEAMLRDLTSIDVRQVIFEQRETHQDARDRQIVAQFPGQFEYRHERSEAEPLLWVPDTLAWCFGRGDQALTAKIDRLGLMPEVRYTKKR